MPLYRSFFKKSSAVPAPVEPTRRIARAEPAARVRLPAPAALPPARTENPVAPSQKPGDALSSPTVGWLAIVAGPGRGEVLRLSYGVNDIGRGRGARVRLDFGDATIAADNHAAILYTTRSRRFYLAQSSAAETWLNGRPVRESVELTGGETVRLGETELRFVPLCGLDFDWRDGG